MTIILCPAHLRELEEDWGGQDAIKRAYGAIIINANKCENLHCLKKTDFYCPYCGKLVKPNMLIERE